MRLLRLLKIARCSPALSTLAQVIANERRALFGTLLLMLCATVFAAASMHAVEGAVQPEAFGTIPNSMWWAITDRCVMCLLLGSVRVQCHEECGHWNCVNRFE